MSVPVGPPRRLSAYVWRAFAGAFGVTLFAVMSLFVVIDGIQHATAAVKAGRHHLAGQLARYYALQLPVIFVQVGPVVTLVAAAFALTRLRRAGELLPIFASGVSLHRALRPVWISAVVLIGVDLALEQWVVPHAAEAVRTEGLSKRRESAIYDLLVEDKANGLMVFMGKYTPARRLMENVHIFEAAESARPGAWRLRGRVFAWEGVWAQGQGWTLRRGYRHAYDADGRRVAAAEEDHFDERPYPALALLPYDLENGARLDVSLGGSVGLQQRAALTDLARLTAAPDAPAAPRVHLHGRIAHPFAHVALLLAGLPLVLRRGARSPVLGALLGGAVCAVYFLLQALCFDLGVRGWIPPALAGWAPVAIVAAVGFTWIDTVPT